MASPSKKRKRQDSHGSLADTSDLGSADGDYTRDSHDIVVSKSRLYKKKQMKKLGMKSSAETSNKDGDGKTKEKKRREDETSALSGQNKDGNVVLNGGTSNNSGAANNLPTSPSKGSSSALLRRKYRRERTSSQSSTGTDHGTTSLSQVEYFPPSGQEMKHTCTTTEEEKNVAPRHNLQTNSAKTSVSNVFPWMPRSQSSQESQPPIQLDADGLLVQEDIFKKPLDPVDSSPSKYSSGHVSKSGKRKKKKHGEKDGTSDETSGVETDTGTSVSTVQSPQEDGESGNEKRHKKKKKKKKEKDKDVESSTLEEQATNVSTLQSGDNNVEGDDEKRHKKKKKKKKKKEQDKVDTSDSQSTSVSTIQHDNVEEDEGKRHKKKKKKKEKDTESSTLEGQVSETEDSDIIPPTQESSKPEKSKKKHKKKHEESGLNSEVNGEEVVPHSQATTLNGNVSSENQNVPNTETAGKKKKKKSKDKRSESAYTSQSESEVPESDVGSPVKSPLAVPRRHAIGDDKANTTGDASKGKPKSTANKLPVWCIEDAGQESQAVSEVFDMFGWGQNKTPSSGTKHSSQGMIRTTSTQPNFDSVVGKGRGISAERRKKDDAFSYQSHDETAVAITPRKKNKLSRKEKQKGDKGKTVHDGQKQQQSNVDDNVGNNAGTQCQPVSSENTREDTAKENTVTESVEEDSSKLPSKSAEDNITERRKGTKNVKTRGVSEEAESTVDKEHSKKTKKIESRRKQHDSTVNENLVEEEDNEENPVEQAQDQAVEDGEDKDQDVHSSGDDFEDAGPSSSTTKEAGSKAKKSRRRRTLVSSGDTEDLWLKGVQALSAEDVQMLREKGVTIRFGHFSRQEKAILKKNMESFCEMHGVEDTRMLLFPHQYEDKKALKKLINEAGLFRHLAQGLDRPLWNVYTKARYMFSNPEISGKFSREEDKKLLKLHMEHGPRWAVISRFMGRFEDNIKQRFRNLEGKNKGHWSPKENKMLIRAVQAVTGQEDITNLTRNIDWQTCSKLMDTVRSAKQCYEHWLVLINWLSFQQGSHIWNPERDAQLIDEIYNSEAEVEFDIDWKAISEKLEWMKHPGHASRRWHRLRFRVPDWDRKDMDEILDYLKEDMKKRLKKWMKKRAGRPALPKPAKSGPFIFTDDEDESSDDDDDDSDDDTLNPDPNTGDHQANDNPASVSDKESSNVDNAGNTSKTGHDNKSDKESSTEDDTDDDSETEVDSSDKGSS